MKKIVVELRNSNKASLSNMESEHVHTIKSLRSEVERLKLENLNIEMINLVNENNVLQKDMRTELDLKGNVDQSRRYLEMRLERLRGLHPERGE